MEMIRSLNDLETFPIENGWYKIRQQRIVSTCPVKVNLDDLRNAIIEIIGDTPIDCESAHEKVSERETKSHVMMGFAIQVRKNSIRSSVTINGQSYPIIIRKVGNRSQWDTVVELFKSMKVSSTKRDSILFCDIFPWKSYLEKVIIQHPPNSLRCYWIYGQSETGKTQFVEMCQKDLTSKVVAFNHPDLHFGGAIRNGWGGHCILVDLDDHPLSYTSIYHRLKTFSVDWYRIGYDLKVFRFPIVVILSQYRPDFSGNKPINLSLTIWNIDECNKIMRDNDPRERHSKSPFLLKLDLTTLKFHSWQYYFTYEKVNQPPGRGFVSWFYDNGKHRGKTALLKSWTLMYPTNIITFFCDEEMDNNSLPERLGNEGNLRCIAVDLGNREKEAETFLFLQKIVQICSKLSNDTKKDPHVVVLAKDTPRFHLNDITFIVDHIDSIIPQQEILPEVMNVKPQEMQLTTNIITDVTSQQFYNSLTMKKPANSVVESVHDTIKPRTTPLSLYDIVEMTHGSPGSSYDPPPGPKFDVSEPLINHVPSDTDIIYKWMTYLVDFIRNNVGRRDLLFLIYSSDPKRSGQDYFLKVCEMYHSDEMIVTNPGDRLSNNVHYRKWNSTCWVINWKQGYSLRSLDEYICTELSHHLDRQNEGHLPPNVLFKKCPHVVIMSDSLPSPKATYGFYDKTVSIHEIDVETKLTKFNGSYLNGKMCT